MRPHKQACSHTHASTTSVQADGPMAWVHQRPRICTCALSLHKLKTPASPSPAFLDEAFGPSPAAASAAHRRSGGHQSAARPRLPTPSPHQSTRPRTHAPGPLIRPPAGSPATLPHARLLAAPPVSRLHVAPPRLGPRYPHALRPPHPSLTNATIAPVHVELAPR
jgi:hypothetical protein